jgi:predicted unusual protein kinase regulating ubiquinone biosynthesis (AarF/ABC1/UbiB family)
LAGTTFRTVIRRRPGRLRYDRGLAALRLLVRGGARYAGSAPRLFAAAGEQRQLLREDLALQTAEDVAATLGAMKGVMMKIGQMASYVDGGLSPAVRRTLGRPQDSVPIWPLTHGPASTRMGEAEASWRARRQAIAA